MRWWRKKGLCSNVLRRRTCGYTAGLNGSSMRRRMRLTVLAVCSAAGVLLACAEAAAPRPDSDPPDNSIPPGPYVAGQSYFGRNSYIEYLAGNAPVVLTAPHGGAVTPGEIPDRTAAACGGDATTVTDLNTRELTLAVDRKSTRLNSSH